MDIPPTGGTPRFVRKQANEETTLLTPISEGTSAVDRIPIGKQRFWTILVAVLAVALLAATGLATYLAVIANQWSDQVDKVKAQNVELGQKISEEQARTVALQGDLDTVNEQLVTAQKRVLEQADELAQRDDNVEYWTRQINDLTATVTTSAGVANALNRCVDAKTEYIGYLQNAQNYTPADLEAFAASVDTLCTNAVDANLALQDLLAK